MLEVGANRGRGGSGLVISFHRAVRSADVSLGRLHEGMLAAETLGSHRPLIARGILRSGRRVAAHDNNLGRPPTPRLVTLFTMVVLG